MASLTIGCAKENQPAPEVAAITPPNNTVTTTVTPQIENFEGVWRCGDWVVDNMTGATKVVTLEFRDQDTTHAGLTLKHYNQDGSFIQRFMDESAYLDSNYFDNYGNIIMLMYKGVMTTDSTMMVYEYRPIGSSIDTFQVKEFKRD